MARHVKEYVDAERLRGNLITDSDERALQDAVAGELVGLGRLKIRSPTRRWRTSTCSATTGCGWSAATDPSVEAGPIADSDEELLQLLQTLARQGPGTERALTTSHPLLDRELVDGSRLAAAHQGHPRPYAAIRRHRHVHVSLDELWSWAASTR